MQRASDNSNSVLLTLDYNDVQVLLSAMSEDALPLGDFDEMVIGAICLRLVKRCESSGLDDWLRLPPIANGYDG